MGRWTKKGLGERRLAAAVLEIAFRDMREVVWTRDLTCVEGEHLGQRAQAGAWLVSDQAANWSRCLGIEHQYLLERGRWKETALDIWGLIERGSPTQLERARVLPHHIRLIREGITRLTPAA